MNLDALKAIVGPAGWTDDPQLLAPHLEEWRGTWKGRTPLLLRPTDTAEVAAILAECNRQGIGVVPQGGNTGLCGGAIPDASGEQVLLSLGRMNRIRSIDPENFSMLAEAGCVLAQVQETASAAGRLFPLSLAAEGSAQVGGVLSTNAGGVNVLRYGCAREQVLGLEVVLADGRVLGGLRSLRKDNTGYDLKQLFIGAEGTLGVITAAVLKLYPPLRDPATALVGVDSAPAAVTLLAALRDRLGDRLVAFELMSARALDMAEAHLPDAENPLAGRAPFFVLLENDGPGDEELVDALSAIIDAGLAGDAAVAKNAQERKLLWSLRHAISAAQKDHGASLKHDVSVPVAAIGRFIETATATVEARWPGVRVVAFGHVGDGNVHFNVTQPADWSASRFLEERTDMTRLVYDLVEEFNGSFSAEHGIGVLKRDELLRYRGMAEVEVMRTLKQALDPHGILNPGKVIAS